MCEATQLADIMKRIGLAERTGRGIDRIYEGMLRYGRPSPDYTMSDAFSVTVLLSKSDADTEFLEMILHHEEQTGTTMPIDSLIILSHLRQERRLTTANISADTQKSEQATRTALEKLAEAGLVEAHGTGRGRTYTLSATMYRGVGQKAAYIRQAGFQPIQQEHMVLTYIDKHGSIKRAEVAELCRLSLPQAYHLLKRLQKQGKIKQIGKMRHTAYTRNAYLTHMCVVTNAHVCWFVCRLLSGDVPLYSKNIFSSGQFFLTCLRLDKPFPPGVV